MTTKRIISIVLIVIAVLFVASIGLGAFTVVDEGFVGVKYQFGKIVDDDLSAGLQFKLPFIQSIKTVDIREQSYEMSTNAYTKDTQTVENLQVKLNYVYDRSQLSNLIRSVGINNVESKLIVPQMQSVMKNAIGKYKAEELVQNRTALQNTIEEELRLSLGESGIVVVSFAIENIDFEDIFEKAIQDKVIAEQQALQKQNETAMKEEEARQVVIAAQAQADSAKIKADADAYAIQTIQDQISQSPEYLEYYKLQVWDGALPQVVTDSANTMIPIN